MLGVLALVVVGLVMTALMQSSTAAVAVTLSASQAEFTSKFSIFCTVPITQNP
jgi:Na+/phosphate symporter